MNAPARWIVAAVAVVVIGAGYLGLRAWLGGGPPSMAQIAERGTLRVAVRPQEISHLPRSAAHPVAIDREVAEDVADAFGVKLTYVVVDDYSKLLPTVRAGRADMVAAGLTITKRRKERVAFSEPYNHVDELLVVPEDGGRFSEPAALDGVTVCVRRSSAYYDTLRWLQRTEAPELEIRTVSEDLDTERVIELVDEGKCPATVADHPFWESVQRAYPGLSAPLAVTRDRPIALALHPEAGELKQRIDERLFERKLTKPREKRYKADWAEIKERGRLRMITRNNAMTYFLHRGEQVGFEYELLKRFADKHDLRLDVVVPPSHGDLIPWLNEGRGDVVAAAMTITPRRRERVAFTRPYRYTEEVVVVREGNRRVTAPEDLVGRTVRVRRSSAYYSSLKALREEVGRFTIEPVPEHYETSRVLDKVARGEWDITVSDSPLLQIKRSYGRELTAAFTLTETSLGWAVRPSSDTLRSRLDAFIRSEYRGLHYNLLKRRYFEDQRFLNEAHGAPRPDQQGEISAYDDLARKYGERYDIDWRLLVAQMFHESRFDPDTVSWAGAVGLMQLMPRTAKEMGIADPADPAQSVKAGAKYMRLMLDRFDDEVDLRDRMAFALAAYNAGYGHVSDARLVARRMGKDPDRWGGNVERAYPRLQDPKVYRETRYGFCQGSRVAAYVNGILDLYETYVQHTRSR